MHKIKEETSRIFEDQQLPGTARRPLSLPHDGGANNYMHGHIWRRQGGVFLMCILFSEAFIARKNLLGRYFRK
jgi:hypothetical protein